MKANGRCKRRLWRGILGCCLAMLAGGELEAALVRGGIVNQYNYPVSGIRVRVVSAQIGPSSFTVSGPDGMYYLQGIPAGGYVLQYWYGDRLLRQFPVQVVEPGTDIPVQKM